MVMALAPFPFVNNNVPANLAQIERGLRLAQGRADLHPGMGEILYVEE